MRYQIVDLRDEIAQFEREHRPFPPRSGSVSKPLRPSTEPETKAGYMHAKFAEIGAGTPIVFKLTAKQFLGGCFEV